MVLTVGFLVLSAISAACVMLAVRSQSDAEWVAHTLRVKAKVSSIQLFLRTAESAERGYLISDDRSYLVIYRYATDPIIPAIADLRALIFDNPVQQRALATIAPIIGKTVDSLREAVRLQGAGDHEAALATVHSGSGPDQMEEINAIADQMTKEEESLLQLRLLAAADSNLLLLVVNLIGIALMIGLAVISILAIRQMAEEALVDSETRGDELQAAVKELEAFSYNVSHDLRSPLRAIDGFSRILLKHHSANLAPEPRGYLEAVRDNAVKMGHLVDDLLAFARLSRKPLNKTRVATAAVVEEVVREVQMQAGERRVHVSVGDLPSVLGDPSLLKQVFVNLIDNAFKYTRQRAEAVIEIGSRENGGERVFFVRDNGAGFDMQYASNLFGVFQRLHRAEDFEGTGVGLAIVQRIVQRHGGRVWADAAVDRGATFYFTTEGPNHA
jgi:signal transduction histidine kinase